MCDTNSSLNGIIGASLMVATFYFHLCAMCFTKSTTPGITVTPLVAASFHLCTMCDTNSSVHDVSGTPLSATFLSNLSHQAVFEKLLLGMEI
jgi:hypothetical protein